MVDARTECGEDEGARGSSRIFFGEGRGGGGAVMGNASEGGAKGAACGAGPGLRARAFWLKGVPIDFCPQRLTEMPLKLFGSRGRGSSHHHHFTKTSGWKNGQGSEVTDLRNNTSSAEEQAWRLPVGHRDWRIRCARGGFAAGASQGPAYRRPHAALVVWIDLAMLSYTLPRMKHSMYRVYDGADSGV